MKYTAVKKIREEKQSLLFEKHGVIFAFSDEQFNRQKKDGVTYVSLFGGTLIPKENAKSFLDDMSDLQKEITELVKEKCDPIECIVYELGNHEYYITYDMSDTQEALSEYDFTEEQYKEARKVYLSRCDY